jgi:hypothetical protein
MEVLYPKCAGLDVHNDVVVACARIAVDGEVTQDVRSFGTTTTALFELSTRLEEQQCTHVVMEATACTGSRCGTFSKGRSSADGVRASDAGGWSERIGGISWTRVTSVSRPGCYSLQRRERGRLATAKLNDVWREVQVMAGIERPVTIHGIRHCFHDLARTVVGTVAVGTGIRMQNRLG